MRILLVLTLLVYASEAFKPPVIHVEDHLVQQHASIGKFVELKEHDNIELKCSGRHDDLKFSFPDMDEHYGFDRTNFENRLEEIDDENFGDRILTISDVRESDTGAYSCVSEEHPSLNDTIYVFVHGKRTFLQMNSVMFTYIEGEAMVPCITTKFVENDDLELFANDQPVKNAHKSYDQRYGFKLTKKIYDVKPIDDVKFECRHKKEPDQEVDYIIRERETTTTSDEDFKFHWDDGFVWPHVGYNYSRTCHLEYIAPNLNNFYKWRHNLKIECPQCTNGHAIPSRAHSDNGRIITASVVIQNLELEDSGKYKCIWIREERDNDVETVYNLHVAPQEAQIKVIERSPQILKVNENNEVLLTTKFAIYPFDGDQYTAKWSRRYNSSLKAGPQSETIINDDFRTITSKSFGNGVYSESLVMKDQAVTTNMTGTYVLSISHLKTAQVVQWEVAIENDKPDVQITVRGPHSFIVFNQQFFPSDTHLHIDCVSVSIPPADVVFERKDSDSSEFQEIDPSLLVKLEGTFEKGYIWNMTLEKDTELRCTSERRGKRSSAAKSIIIAEGEPVINSTITKSIKSTESEDPKVVYEGDTVTLNCVVPNGATDWDVTWRFADSPTPETSSLPFVVEDKGISKHVILSLYDITTTSSGKYVCVLKKGDSEKLLETVVNVEKTLKPYHTNADSQRVVTAQFDQNFVIDCHMAGNPTPIYQWFKDGNPYTAGERNGSLLKVTRARAEDDGQFHCLATNRAGMTKHFIEVKVEGAPKGSSLFYWVVFIVAVIFICVVAVLTFKLRATKQITKQKDIALRDLYRTMLQENVGPLPENMKALPIEERTYYLPYNKNYEIDPANLEILETLGSGQFGFVRKGYLQMADPKSQMEYKTRLPVAIKSSANPYDVEAQRMMAEELKVMCAIPKHPNILSLVGAVTANMRKGQLFIVTEYVDGGDLRAFLQKHRNVFINELVEDVSSPTDDSYLVPNSVKKKKYQFEDKSGGESDRLLSVDIDSLRTSDLLSFGLQIANGMNWLANVPCVHRDLACRNILITKSKIVRIADFGLAKKHSNNKEYYRIKKNKDTPLPVRWMSLEAIEELKFTEKSDVWSFGICLYEIFTLGSAPYPSIDNLAVIDYIKKGNRNTQPDYCHEEIYALMTHCWQAMPRDRPTFAECIACLKDHMSRNAGELLDRVDKMLFMEIAEQMKLGEWIQKSRPAIPGANFKKSPKKPAEERYLVVESHA